VVSDPTKDERSGFDQERYEKSDEKDERARLRGAGLCDVSQVFGATGWRRRFSLIIHDSTSPDTLSPQKIEANRFYTNAKGKTLTPTWWFKDHPRSGILTIRAQSLAQDFPPESIGGLLQFIADWAAVGAKAQMGFGVIEPVNCRIDTRPLYDWLTATAGNHPYPRLPSLQNIFLVRIQRQAANDQETFNLKYDLRQLFSGQQNRGLRHFIMGTVKGERMAAKVKMSRPYGDGLIRVWGWIPEEADVYENGWSRDKVLDAIYNHLKTHYTVQVWREMNSLRDTVSPNNTDAEAFLRSLLALEEEDNAA
jgi:CRISPR-associated protein Cmr1